MQRPGEALVQVVPGLPGARDVRRFSDLDLGDEGRVPLGDPGSAGVGGEDEVGEERRREAYDRE